MLFSIFFLSENALYLLSISLKNALYFALYFSVCALYGYLDSMKEQIAQSRYL